jgi:AcrR family transcriptional regulator
MNMSTPSSGRSGRRPGSTQTREAIADAAREQFAERGYERATMRSIAESVGVDPALIVHFFGTKEALFEEVMALPPAIEDLFRTIAQLPRGQVGRRLAAAIVASLDNPETRAVVVGRIRSAATHPGAAALVREMVSRDLGLLTRTLTDDRPETRAVLLGVQVTGLAVVRYIAAIEPLASMPPDQLVDLVAPVFQRLLVEPLAE